MSIIWAIIIGFIVGVVAKLLMPGKEPNYQPEELAGFFMSIIGAMILLFIYHLATKDKAATP